MQNTANRSTLVRSRSLPDVIGLGGAIAGLLAGAVMVLLSPLLSYLNGISVWEPPRLIASTVLGSTVLNDTGFAAGPVLVGLLVHMLTSVALGVVFGVIVNRVLHLTTDFGLPIYMGLVYGLIIFFIAYFIILPIVNPALTEDYVAALIAQNVVFGMCLGIFYTLVRPKHFTNTVERQ